VAEDNFSQAWHTMVGHEGVGWLDAGSIIINRTDALCYAK
jgi:hypothetical protein